MLEIYIGDGKGKTTAAAGAAIRAAGTGNRVLYARFMKSRDSGETEILKKIPGVSLYTLRRRYPFFKDMTDLQKKEITEEHNYIFDNVYRMYRNLMLENQSCMVVFDEFFHAQKFGLTGTDDIFERIKEMSDYGEVILTGREITEDAYFDQADYITEMKKIKHPYDKGVMARKGIEY